MRIFPLFVAAVAAVGCSTVISNEDRLERDTQGMGNAKPVLNMDELARIRCTDVEGDLTKARNVDRPETDRVQSYADLYLALQKKALILQEALQRNPDLSYREEAEKIRSARDACVQQTADVKVEFERYTRELVDVPIVQEVRGGRTVSVARLDFGTLRKAIQLLDTDDREAMLQRVASAEKRVEATPTPTRKK